MNSNRKYDLGFLTEEWKSGNSNNDNILSSNNPAENQKTLQKVLANNPIALNGLPVSDITDILEKVSGLPSPDKKVLLAIYSAYSFDSSKEYRLLEIDQRIEFLATLLNHPKLLSEPKNWQNLYREQREALALELMSAQTNAYNFSSPSLVSFDKPAEGPLGKQIISSGFYEWSSHSVNYNCHTQTPEELVSCYYQQSQAKFLTTIAHELEHANQNTLADRFLENDIESEIRDIGRIFHFSMKKGYILKTTDGFTLEETKKNPSEQHAYDFEKDIELFLNGDTNSRRKIIEELIEKRTQLTAIIPAYAFPQNYPQPSPACQA